MFTPRWYQTEAVNSTIEYFRLHDEGNPLIVKPTGTGKSWVIAMLLQWITKNYPSTRMMVLTHVKELIEQDYEKIQKLWPDAPTGIYSAALRKRDRNNQIIFASVKSVLNEIQRSYTDQIDIHPLLRHFGRRDIVVVDEAHLISPDAATTYRKVFAELKKTQPHLRVIGLTATPYRLGQGLLTAGKTPLFTDIAYDLSTKDNINRLVAEGHMAPLVSRPVNVHVDTSNVSIDSWDFNSGELGKEIQKVMYPALLETAQVGAETNRKSCMVFCSSVENCETAVKILHSLGVTAACVHSKKKPKENDNIIKAFKRFEFKVLVSNNKLTTGFDHPGLDLICMLRATVSPGLWCLSEQTEVLTNSGFKKYNEISIGDKVLGFNSNTKKLETTEILNYVHRGLEDGEKLLEYNSRSFKFCVTNTHNMIYEQRAKNNNWNIRKAQLFKILNNSNKRLICSTETFKPGLLEYSLPALKLLGLYLSDGSFDKSNNTLVFHQSERYLNICLEIENLLKLLNLKYRVKIKKPEQLTFKTSFSMRRYIISKTSKTGFGWSSIFEVEDFKKELNNKFVNMSLKQFESLLYGVNLGDGCKFKSPSIYWTPKTMSISTGNINFANNMQFLCLHNGYKCTISTDLKTNLKPLYKMYIKKTKVVKFDKKFITDVSLSSKKVWCIETELGNIVTRYKGHVMITGNCQMLGRGTRPFEGKVDCMVLDYGNNIARLGPFNDIRIPKEKSDKIGDAPVKICPQSSCQQLNHAAARECAYCGHKFPIRVNIVHSASTDKIMAESDFPRFEEFDVDNVFFTRHQKEGKKACIKAIYACGLKSFNHWLFIEAGGLVGKNARDWWRLHSPNEPPQTTDEAMSRIKSGELKQAARVEVHINKKYPEIKNFYFE